MPSVLNDVRSQALELATAFDRRNGNDFYQRDLVEVERLVAK